MRHFIYFRNKEYAEKLAIRYSNSYIKNTESEVFGITPLEDDVFIIDAHFGNGKMSELRGLNIAYKLLSGSRISNLRITILSWFPEKYILERFPIAKELAQYNTNIKFIQLPAL